jgi:hypothetical protein
MTPEEGLCLTSLVPFLAPYTPPHAPGPGSSSPVKWMMEAGACFTWLLVAFLLFDLLRGEASLGSGSESSASAGVSEADRARFEALVALTDSAGS